MKALINLAPVVLFLFCLQSQALAANQGINGPITGGGAGAILGQAAGRNVESTIIGAAVGGILGAAIGAETSYRHRDRVIVYEGLYGLDGPGDWYLNYAPGYSRPYMEYSRPLYRGYKTDGDTVIIIKRNCGRGYLHEGDCRPYNRGYYRLRQSDHRPVYNQDTR